MNLLDFVLLLLAALAFFGAASIWRARNPQPYWNVSLVPLGLLLWVLVPLIHAAKAL